MHAVNVTGPQLLQSGFVGEIKKLLQRHGLGPADLELEVTETVLLGRSAEQVENTLREVRALGVALSLDDFGTGFASLTHLRRFPIDRIKIDRSFVADIGIEPVSVFYWLRHVRLDAVQAASGWRFHGASSPMRLME